MPGWTGELRRAWRAQTSPWVRPISLILRRRSRRAGGETAYARLRWQSDPQVQAIVSGWPPALATPRAEALGFGRDRGIDEVVEAFIEDDLPAQKQLVL